jgi:hypothetical protein
MAKERLTETMTSHFAAGSIPGPKKLFIQNRNLSA